MGLLDELLLRVNNPQRDTPGGDQVMRPVIDWGQVYKSDPGIYGQGRGRAYEDLTPPLPVQPWQGWRQLRSAHRVNEDLGRGLDPVLTGSGLELSPAEIGGRPSVLEMLMQALRDRPSAPPLIENWR